MRTSSQALAFWQFDVALYDDPKIEDLNEEYGPLGEAVFFRILCYIAKTDGYFAQLNESLLRYVYRSVGSRWIKKAKITEIIQYCGVCGLFDVNLLTQNVITSQGIQRRWLYAKKKSRARGFLTDKFWLLEGSELYGYTDNSDNCDNKGDNCSNNDDNCYNYPIEREENKNTNSFSHSIAREREDEAVENSEEDVRLRYLGGKLGGGVVMLSDEQFNALCDELSSEELDKYIGIVRDCELSGKHYKKSHYQAIRDMVKKDRKVKKN